jgi:hypothetical protein
MQLDSMAMSAGDKPVWCCFSPEIDTNMVKLRKEVKPTTTNELYEAASSLRLCDCVHSSQSGNITLSMRMCGEWLA